MPVSLTARPETLGATTVPAPTICQSILDITNAITHAKAHGYFGLPAFSDTELAEHYTELKKAAPTPTSVSHVDKEEQKEKEASTSF
jgi:hypothetical protein